MINLKINKTGKDIRITKSVEKTKKTKNKKLKHKKYANEYYPTNTTFQDTPLTGKF